MKRIDWFLVSQKELIKELIIKKFCPLDYKDCKNSCKKQEICKECWNEEMEEEK